MNFYFKKIAALLLTFAFLFNLSAQSVYSSVILTLPASYNINKDFTVNSGDASAANMIILIQDLHCHFDTQNKIASFLNNIADTPSFNKIFVEGSSKNIESSFIKHLPDNIKTPLISSLLDQGKLSGAEYFFLSSNKNAPLYGLENETLYSDNALRLEYILSTQNEVKFILNGMSSALEQIHKEKLDKESKRMLSVLNKYENGMINNDKFYRYLIKRANKLDVNLNEYPVIKNILGHSKKISTNKVKKELEQFLESAKRTLPYKAYKELAGDNIFDKILELREKSTIDVSIYPELSKYLDTYENTLKVDPLKLYDEERNLINAILLQTSGELNAEIIILTMAFEKIKNFMENNATDRDFKYLEEFEIEYFGKLWNKNLNGKQFAALQPYMSVYQSYYDVNDMRNQSFVDKILATHNKNSGGVSAVITGGFHTEELKNILTEKGFGVMVLTPRISGGLQDAEEKYIKLFNEKGNSQIVSAFIDGYALKLYLDTGNKTSLVETLGEINKLYHDGIFGNESIESLIAKVITEYNKENSDKVSITEFNAENAKSETDITLTTSKNQEIKITFKKNGEATVDDLDINRSIPPASIFNSWQSRSSQGATKSKFMTFISNPLIAPIWETFYIFGLAAVIGPIGAIAVFVASHFIADMALSGDKALFTRQMKEKGAFKKYATLLAASSLFVGALIMPVALPYALIASWILHTAYNIAALNLNLARASIFDRNGKKFEIYPFEQENGIPVFDGSKKITAPNLTWDEYSNNYGQEKVIIRTRATSETGAVHIFRRNFLTKNMEIAGKEVAVVIDKGNVTEMYVIESDGTISESYTNANLDPLFSEYINFQKNDENINFTEIYEYNAGGTMTQQPKQKLNYYENFTRPALQNRYRGRRVILVKKIDSNGNLQLFSDNNLVYLNNKELAGKKARVLINARGAVERVLIEDTTGRFISYTNINQTFTDMPIINFVYEGTFSQDKSNDFVGGHYASGILSIFHKEVVASKLANMHIFERLLSAVVHNDINAFMLVAATYNRQVYDYARKNGKFVESIKEIFADPSIESRIKKLNDYFAQPAFRDFKTMLGKMQAMGTDFDTLNEQELQKMMASIKEVVVQQIDNRRPAANHGVKKKVLNSIIFNDGAVMRSVFADNYADINKIDDFAYMAIAYYREGEYLNGRQKEILQKKAEDMLKNIEWANLNPEQKIYYAVVANIFAIEDGKFSDVLNFDLEKLNDRALFMLMFYANITLNFEFQNKAKEMLDKKSTSSAESHKYILAAYTIKLPLLKIEKIDTDMLNGNNSLKMQATKKLLASA